MPGAEKQESPVLVVERSNSFSQLKLLRSGLKQWLMLECSNNNPNCTQSFNHQTVQSRSIISRYGIQVQRSLFST